MIVVVAETPGGSFKLVTLAPKTVKLLKETKEWGHKQVSLANH